MTVMIDRFFGLPQQVIRSGLWKAMRSSEKDLYVFLMQESERCCTRQVHCTDAEITKAVGLKPRTLCNARKKLQERGLIACARHQGNKYEYTICDLATGKPYPGNPKERIVYAKQNTAQAVQEKPPEPSSAATVPPPPVGQDLESHGVSGIFH